MPSIKVNGASLYYQLHGDAAKPAVVLAHGRGGNAASWWQQVPVFSADYRVVTFDHRGFARSHCDSREDFDPRRFADDLAAILDDARIGRATLVCQSMGGRTGLGFALKFPQRVTGLVLCGTTGGLYDETIAKGLGEVLGVAAQVGSLATLALEPTFPQRQPALASLYAQIQAFNTEFDYGGPPILTAPETRVDPALLKGWSIPTLVLGGSNDQIVAASLLPYLAKMIPGAELKVLPGLGHSTYFEDATAFNTLVGEFLRKHVR
ncbi:MAG: alpha/beta hydrolase [Alphaproteobacteria bacterium]|nr:alpha/beta hydrolase [Alphaproteobacteria bacterium]